jgi:hypothetical protein
MSDAQPSSASPEARQDTAVTTLRSPLRHLGSSIDELVDRRHVVHLDEFTLHETLGKRVMLLVAYRGLS